MQFLQKTEDARVHYAVLKIRTEPCLRAPQPGGPSTGRSSQRPGKSGCFLRTQQCARNPAVRRPPFRSPQGGSVLAGSPQASEPNSQCSTRKHGRPGERMPPEGAGAP